MPRSSNIPLKKQKAFQQLKQLHQQPGRHDLLWYHRVGEQVTRLCPTDERAYGQSRIQSVAEALGKSATYGDTLWKARSFFEKYKRSEVRSLCKSEAASGFVLTWSHLQALISLDEDHRVSMQKACLIEEWSSRELHRRTKELREQPGQGGRRFRKPKDVAAALRQLIQESRTWDRRYREVWFHPEAPAIRLEAGNRKSQEVGALAAEAVEVLETLQSDIEEGLLRLKALKTPKKSKRRGRAGG